MDLGPRNTTHHPRSTRAARLVYSVKRAADRKGLMPARLRKPLRRVYARANAGRPPEQMTVETRQHVEDLYRASNEQTARTLLEHGYRDLPAWLAATSHQSGQPSQSGPSPVV
jgi:hypothetical protein